MAVVSDKEKASKGATAERTTTKKATTKKETAKKQREETIERVRQEKRRQKKAGKRILIALLILVVLLGGAVAAYQFILGGNVRIVVKADSISIIEGEEVPSFTVQATSTSDRSKRLPPFGKRTVGDVLDELNSGMRYEVFCDSRGDVEGEYPIEIEIAHSLKQELGNNLVVENGTLLVKNRYGEWDGDRFKRHNGSYVQEDFIEWQGDRYYFDAQENKVTGEIKIKYTLYTFDAQGRLVSEVQLIDPDKPMVALTYDDGPGPRTGEVLEVLEANAAYATFFMLGQNIYESNSHLLQKMVEIGCEVANHSWSHPDLSRVSEETVRVQIEDTNASILAATGGVASTTMRPPYGAVNATVKEAANMPIIFWNIDTLDWQHRDAQTTVDSVMNSVKDGDIILMHDIHDATIEASKMLIPKLKEAGFQLVTVSDLAQIRGVVMEPGVIYSSFPKE
jgi:Predicted xylanase/chitin deacetylase